MIPKEEVLNIADTVVRLVGWRGVPDFFQTFRTDRRPVEFEIELPLKHPDEQLLTLHRAVTEFLLSKDVLLFHASGVAIDGNGYAFTAPSGTGKSTHSALLKKLLGDRLTYVNDDKPYLFVRDDGIYMTGSPWEGKHRLGNAITVPLKGICFLSQEKENRIRRMDPFDAYTSLLRQIYMPEKKENVEKTLGLVEKVVMNVPCFHLGCTPTIEAAEVSSAAMTEKPSGDAQ